jgi:hypothetical protein
VFAFQAAANCARCNSIGIVTISGDPRRWLLPAAVRAGAIAATWVVPAIEPAIPVLLTGDARVATSVAMIAESTFSSA